MKPITITSVSSKGQIVVPMDIRKEMGLSVGMKLMILTDGDNLLLKPVKAPKLEAFRELVKASRTYAKQIGLKKAAVKKAIKKARQ